MDRRKMKQIEEKGIWGTKYVIIPNFKEKEEPFISKDEFKMYRCLEEIYKDTDIRISTQVALNQILQINTKRYEEKLLKHYIGRSLDFVLFNPKNQKIICCIELNDKTHINKRTERDIFLQEAFEYTSIPIIFIASQDNYNQKEIKEIINRELNEKYLKNKEVV